MASNGWGTLFKITTWGESHGKAVGVVIDGCPAGLPLCVEEIDQALAQRAPGKSPYTSPRDEADRAEILSGVFEGQTTGAPLSIAIANRNCDSSKYEPIKELLRPGHANSTYLQKYGVFDYRGGGRSSARETACRVAAGAVAKKILRHYGDIQVAAYVAQIGAVQAASQEHNWSRLREHTYASALYCPDAAATTAMSALLERALAEGDSVGGIVAFIVNPVPKALGDPVYEKLEAKLAHALMGLPAAKGFEIGSGFAGATWKGSEHNDSFIIHEGAARCATNHAGGLLGGITTGMPLYGRVAFKPASSIRKSLPTVTIEGKPATFTLPEGSRHDPCVAIRAVPVVEAMVALVLVDALLLDRSARL